MSVRGSTAAGTVVSFQNGELLDSTAAGLELELLGQTFALNFFWLSRHDRYAMLVSTRGRNLGYVNVAPTEYRLFKGAFDNGLDLVVAFAANDEDAPATPGIVTAQYVAMLTAGVYD